MVVAINQGAGEDQEKPIWDVVKIAEGLPEMPGQSFQGPEFLSQSEDTSK